MNYAFFERLSESVPGSVKIDREKSTVTLKGWSLEELKYANDQQHTANGVEEKPCGLNCSPLKGEDAFPETILLIDGRFKRVVNPLSNAYSNAAKSDKPSGACGECRKHASASEQEDESTKCDQDFVPGIKGQFRKWILQVRRFLFTPISKF